MKTKKPSKAEVRARNLEAITNLAYHGRKSGNPTLVRVLQCLTELYLGSDWRELPDGRQTRRIFSWWGIRCLGNRVSYAEVPWSEKVARRASVTNALINQFMFAVLRGNHRTIRRIADAVKLTQDRLDVDTIVYVKARNPRLLKIIRNSVGSTLPTKAREIREAIASENCPDISERTARRYREGMGLKPGKRGRPPKSPK
jgi:hypothetical protein